MCHCSCLRSWPGVRSADLALGGIVGYQGPAGCAPQFQTFFNSVDVTPTCGAGAVVQDIDRTFLPTSSLMFQLRQLGAPWSSNELQFVPAGPQAIQDLGDEILLGTVLFTNGSWIANGTFGGDFRIALTTSSDDPAFDGHTLSDSITLRITPPGGPTPEHNADFIYLNGFSSLGSVRVYESFDSPTGLNTGGAALFGRISSVIPSRLADPQGAAFLDPGISQAPTPMTPVPEPATLALTASGLAAVVIRGRRRKGRCGK
jgi:hypothetical protein